MSGPPPRWYAVAVPSGSESRVAERIERAARSKSADGVVRKAFVPSREVVVRKNGKKLALKKALYPGYVFVLMYLTPVSWRLIRSVPGVVGVVSCGRRPASVGDGEVST